MPMRRTLLLFAWSGVLSAAFAQARPEPEALAHAQQAQAAEIVTQWLQDPQPQRQAWAAYFILRDRRRDLIPLLMEDVGRYRNQEPPSSQAQSDEEAAMQAKLDALIQLDAQVPGQDAAKLYARFPAQAMILLARDAAAHPQELFAIFDHAKTNEMWLAAGNLLAALRPRGLAARLLANFTLNATVEVRDPAPYGGGRGGSVYDYALPTLPAREGWPEIGSYAPTLRPLRGSVIIAPGPQPVYYNRTVDRSYLLWKESYDGSASRDHYKHQYLAFLVEDMPLPFEPKLQVIWTDPGSYQRSVSEFTLQIGAQYSALTTELKRRDLLTDAERRDVKLHVLWNILDQRRASRDALPRTVASEKESWFPAGNAPAL